MPQGPDVVVADLAPARVGAGRFDPAELEGIVASLEQGKASLDTAISSYERGAALKQHCEAKLREAQAKVDKIVTGPDGESRLEPANID